MARSARWCPLSARNGNNRRHVSKIETALEPRFQALFVDALASRTRAQQRRISRTSSTCLPRERRPAAPTSPSHEGGTAS
jgi:hypothetical protein